MKHYRPNWWENNRNMTTFFIAAQFPSVLEPSSCCTYITPVGIYLSSDNHSICLHLRSFSNTLVSNSITSKRHTGKTIWHHVLPFGYLLPFPALVYLVPVRLRHTLFVFTMSITPVVSSYFSSTYSEWCQILPQVVLPSPE